MSLVSHLNELKKKHHSLEDKLHRIWQQPGARDVEIKRIKQMKLRLKDEIERLRTKVA